MALLAVVKALHLLCLFTGLAVKVGWSFMFLKVGSGLMEDSFIEIHIAIFGTLLSKLPKFSRYKLLIANMLVQLPSFDSGSFFASKEFSSYVSNQDLIIFHYAYAQFFTIFGMLVLCLNSGHNQFGICHYYN